MRGTQGWCGERKVGAGNARCGAGLLVFRQNLARAMLSSIIRHGPVKMLKAQLAGPGNGVVFFPFFGGAVAARNEQVMQKG